jgi:hypothetical protein
MKPLFIRSRQGTISAYYGSSEDHSTTSRRSASNKRGQLQYATEVSTTLDTSAVPTDTEAECILEARRSSTRVGFGTSPRPRTPRKKVADTEPLHPEQAKDAFSVCSPSFIYDGSLYPASPASATHTARPEILGSFNNQQIMITKSISVSERDT